MVKVVGVSVSVKGLFIFSGLGFGRLGWGGALFIVHAKERVHVNACETKYGFYLLISCSLLLGF